MDDKDVQAIIEKSKATKIKKTSLTEFQIKCIWQGYPICTKVKLAKNISLYVERVGAVYEFLFGIYANKEIDYAEATVLVNKEGL